MSDSVAAPAPLSLATLLAEWPDAFADRVLALDSWDALQAWLAEVPLTEHAVLRAPLASLRDLEAGPVDGPLLLALGLRALGYRPLLWSLQSGGQAWLLVSARDAARQQTVVGAVVTDSLGDSRWRYFWAATAEDAVRLFLADAHLPAPSQVLGPLDPAAHDDNQWPSEEDGVVALLQALEDQPDHWPSLPE